MKALTSDFIQKAEFALIVLLFTGCASFVSQSPAKNNPTETASAEIKPVSNVPPAEDFRQVTVVTGLENPWGMAWLPDGAILITERPGRLRIVRNGKLDPTPITGVPPVLAVSQGGLLDISLHPNFAKNRLIYLTYAHGTERANRTRVARATFDGKALKNLQVIFEVSQAKPGGQHFGSRMTWLPDNTMLVSIGDGGNPPIQLNGELIRKQAQNLKSHLGKIVRLNDDGTIPKDNPFVTNKNAEPAVWSYGHRNIQGLTFDPISQKVWASEHGSRGGDEINQIQPGKNYGWAVVTYSQEYTGGEISPERSRAGIVNPQVVWTPSIAPSGLSVYNGDKFPQYKGDLFSGGLVSQDVRHIDLDANGNIISQRSLNIGQRVRDVRQGADGFLYVLTDEQEGQLIRLEPSGSSAQN
ncbi:PQQ-dependent sugar dehydrogenase [Calothrix sp. UHCC 0171]|uniref:PQQ-dependent sugar dehydrogenase n=1 Tax=Calothrix sp. UHCC 0171 TaxID=3110245 RepID=UPI002B217BCD|nr:PQQ-dependent sugar dehydrogenase [Calothrix sp. UHCC 0171]MEA5569907.1 PQQ-dependent sugar dehydrogenase [Calothrix sp. UHCC 0171]